MRKLTSYTAVFLLGFVLCAAALKMYGADITPAPDKSKQVVLAALEKPAPIIAASPGQSVIADAAAKVEPSVVTIDTESKPIPTQNPFGGDPFFRQFFGGGGNAPQQPETRRGAASGVIISPDGYILTNNHVVAGADVVKINLSDGKAYRAKVIGTDPTTDIAVVKVEAPNVKLAAAQFADSNSLRVGDMVIAVGNPLDVGTTVTFGIISALGHRNGVAAGSHPLASNIIQTDAAINPGNSGGALADINGRIIGINEAIYSPTGAYVGIGFAIPIDTAKDIAAQLIRTGHVERSYIGIAYSPIKVIDQQSRQQVGIDYKGDQGVVVTQVYPGSPAAQAGLKEYDVVLEANRQALTDDTPLTGIIAKLKPGSRLVLKVYRDGAETLIPVTLAQMPNTFGQTSDSNNGEGSGGDDGQIPGQP